VGGGGGVKLPQLRIGSFQFHNLTRPQTITSASQQAGGAVAPLETPRKYKHTRDRKGAAPMC